jgi:hypothetical protein
MNALRGTDWGNKVEAEAIGPTDGDREVSDLRGSVGCEGVCNGCDEILHRLNNVLASMLLNAQVMEWKLPSYSRSRRYLHEIERNAQRGGELVKQLLQQLGTRCPADLHDSRSCGDAPSRAGANGAVSSQEPNVTGPAVRSTREPEAHPTAVFLAHRKKVPHTMV